jgi:5,6-dimethylbenzimidazole synthase
VDYEDFLRLVKTRKSVRRYKSEPVPDGVLEKILEAARQAPSAANSQPWEFVVIRDPEARKKVSKGIALKIKEEVGKDPDIARGIAVQPFLYTAPVIIAVLGDLRLQEAYPAWMDRYALMRQSLSNTIYTLQLAAACFGLTTAWGTIQSGPTQDAVKKILGIPESYTVDHMVPVGYADHEAEDKQATLRTLKKRARFRRDLDELVHLEHYRMEKFRSDEAVKAFVWENTVTRIQKS